MINLIRNDFARALANPSHGHPSGRTHRNTGGSQRTLWKRLRSAPAMNAGTSHQRGSDPYGTFSTWQPEPTHRMSLPMTDHQKSPRILYCHCQYAQVILPRQRPQSWRACVNLPRPRCGRRPCEMAARQDPALQSQPRGPGQDRGLFSTSHQGLFAGIKAPLDRDNTEVLNMREISAETVLQRLEKRTCNPIFPDNRPPQASESVPQRTPKVMNLAETSTLRVVLMEPEKASQASLVLKRCRPCWSVVIPLPEPRPGATLAQSRTSMLVVGEFTEDNAPPIWRAKVLRCALRRRQAWIPKAWFKKLSPCEVMHRLSSMGMKPWFPVIDYDRCTNCMQCLSFCLLAFTVWTMAIASGPRQRPVQDQLPAVPEDSGKRPSCSQNTSRGRSTVTRSEARIFRENENRHLGSSRR